MLQDAGFLGVPGTTVVRLAYYELQQIQARNIVGHCLGGVQADYGLKRVRLGDKKVKVEIGG